METAKPSLAEQWAELVQTAESCSAEAEQALREGERAVAIAAEAEPRLERALPVWPHQVCNHYPDPLFWKLGLPIWVGRARLMHDLYRDWTRSTINVATGELDWQRRVTEKQLRHYENVAKDELNRRLVSIDGTVTPLEEQARKIAMLVATAESAVHGLLELPLGRIRQPKGLARYLPVMRQETDYRADDLQRAMTASENYGCALTMMERVQNWIPDQFYVRVTLASAKVDFYRELLRPRSDTLRRIAEYASNAATFAPDLACQWAIDLGEMFFQLFKRTKSWRWAGLAREYFERGLQANCPAEWQAVALDRLNQLHRHGV